ncbi:MAG: helix-turn-helix transcriptional regulator, partial [Clostridia bacterium]|nr:helix-turn-helix transcriptional regulator [Clostridia bacterium]
MKINIGQNIKRLRAAKEVTQEGLAEAMNVTPAAVSKWERGESYPDITLLQPLAFFFGVSLDELVGYDREKVSADIDKVLEEVKKQWLTDPWKARETLFNAYREYPNDYR